MSCQSSGGKATWPIQHQCHRGISAGEALGIESSTGDDMMAHSYFSPEVDDVRRHID